MKSLILSILPALEEETSEDFERAFTIVQNLEVRHADDHASFSSASQDRGFFWQCMFLAIITGRSRRQGALNYLVRRLPSFAPKAAPSSQSPYHSGLSPEAETVLLPEPGLLVRSFVAGLLDTQSLVQRGFLDVLVTHLPLHSPVLQTRVNAEDCDQLMAAATSIVTRRDMSLNRRLWAWLLGPETRDDGAESGNLERRDLSLSQGSRQLEYFSTFGLISIQRYLLSAFSNTAGPATDNVRHFRICLSLMDRWEIGEPLIPRLFLPAMRSVYHTSQTEAPTVVADVIRSASLFFDGVESRLIWSELFKLVDPSTLRSDDLGLFLWILQTFNVGEEEMLTLHIPLVSLFMLESLNYGDTSGVVEKKLQYQAILQLLNLIPSEMPGETNGKQSESLQHSPSRDTRTDIRKFYNHDAATTHKNDPPLSQHHISEGLLANAVKDLSRSAARDPDNFIQAANVVIALCKKIPALVPVTRTTILDACESCMKQSDTSDTLNLTSAVVALLGEISTSSDGSYWHAQQQQWGEIIERIVKRVWPHLSPSSSRQQVEAVHLLWQADDIDPAADTVKATLNHLMSGSDVGGISHGIVSWAGSAENVRRFATLWKHSMPPPASMGKLDTRLLRRRGSTRKSHLDPESWERRRYVMDGLLFMALDALSGSSDASRGAAKQLLASPSSVDVILQLILDKMAHTLPNDIANQSARKATMERDNRQHMRELASTIRHVESVITCANTRVWQSMSENPISLHQDTNLNMIVWLATECVALIGQKAVPMGVQERAISVLSLLMNGPVSVKAQVQSLELDDVLLRKTVDSITECADQLQEPLLKLSQLAMDMRLLRLPSEREDANSIRSSLVARRQSTFVPHGDVNSPQTRPPSYLLSTLKAGFSSQSAQSCMDAWLNFLASSFPIFGDSLIANLIPLVDTFCAQLRLQFEHLESDHLPTAGDMQFAPDTVILWLLDGLDLILAEAHDLSIGLEDTKPARTTSEASPSMLQSLSSAAFKSQGPIAPSSNANSRLTIVLAFKDAVKISLDIWTWTGGAASNQLDGGASSASYSAVRLRSRTRSMLEQIYSVETLESLEVLMEAWCHSSEVSESANVLNLLQAMSPSRPKSVLPATLDALCSRTNMSAASTSRQSSLTTDLSAAEILAFLAAFLENLDADATDEIWPDCTAFMRDVLANPLPFRQVLPGLLWIALILAERLDNTNFGDQRKMRRELGDLFQRLLAASFAASPSASHQARSTPANEETELAAGRQSMNLTVILKDVMQRIESILESPDRIANAVNAITTGMIAPAMHAKAFPTNVHPDTLALAAVMVQKAPAAKPWKKEISDAFARPQILEIKPDIMQRFWFPLIHQWSTADRERMGDLLNRLVTPSSAGIMFGVGAAAARVKADSETQFVLRRMCLLLLASPQDTYISAVHLIQIKLTELSTASASSSPSCSVKAEIFMLCRALLLSIGHSRLAPLWPLINSWLYAALASLTQTRDENKDITNLALLQGCKLLDFLLALSPDEYQLHEWLFVTDTTDAIHHPLTWESSALSDQLAEELGMQSPDGVEAADVSASVADAPRDYFSSVDTEDIKAMEREEFARSVARPYLSQLSINAYEAVYRMEARDLLQYRRALLEDVLDVSTMVKND